MLGDVEEGNGDPSRAQFGEEVTPNQHALARQFGLYDNIHSMGTNSAEGHHWLMQQGGEGVLGISAAALAVRRFGRVQLAELHRGYTTADHRLGRWWLRAAPDGPVTVGWVEWSGTGRTPGC